MCTCLNIKLTSNSFNYGETMYPTICLDFSIVTVYNIRTIMYQKWVIFLLLHGEIPALLGPSVKLFSYPFPKCYDFIMMMGKVHIIAFNTVLHSRLLINCAQNIQMLCLENWLDRTTGRYSSPTKMWCFKTYGVWYASRPVKGPNKLLYFTFLKSYIIHSFFYYY
jgi:hypothetical protein